MTFAAVFRSFATTTAATTALALPALGEAHNLSGVPHSHDASAWGGFVAATAVGYAVYVGLKSALQRRRQRTVRRPDRR